MCFGVGRIFCGLFPLYGAGYRGLRNAASGPCGRGRRKGSMALTKEGGPPAVLTSPFGWRSAHLTSVPESSMKPPGFMLSGSMNVPPPPGRLNFFRWNGPLTERDTLHSGSVSLLLSFHHTCPSTNRQAAVAATEPSAAAVVSWRRVLVRQSPAVKTPEVLVRQSSPATI